MSRCPTERNHGALQAEGGCRQTPVSPVYNYGTKGVDLCPLLGGLPARVWEGVSHSHTREVFAF